jgi:hypothetical protein
MFYPVGMNLGYGFSRRSSGGSSLTLGAEASIARVFRSLFWFGGYVDALHDFAAGEQRISVGPEFGWGPFGVDGGFLVIRSSRELQHGFVARTLLTTGILSLYGRYGCQVSGATDHFGELGILMKLPLPIPPSHLWRFLTE